MKTTKRYCLALDLIDDSELIRAYEQMHENVWSEIIASIKESGIEQLELYRVENRLIMVIETTEGFSFEEKAKIDEANPRVVEWEKLMWKYQKNLPNTRSGEKWRLMENIFEMSI